MFKDTILNNQRICMEHRLMENFNTRVTINTTPQLITLTLLHKYIFSFDYSNIKYLLLLRFKRWHWIQICYNFKAIDDGAPSHPPPKKRTPIPRKNQICMFVLIYLTENAPNR